MNRPELIVAADSLIAQPAEASVLRGGADNGYRAKVWLTLIMWGSISGVFTLLSFLDRDPLAVPAMAVRAGLVVFGIGLCFALHKLLQLLASRSFMLRAVTLVIAAPLAAEIYAWASYFGFAWLNGAPMRFVVDDWNAAVRQVLFYTWFFVGWSGLYLAIEYSYLARREQNRAVQLEILAQRAKLQALSSQVNPHFLFNSLNSISALILESRRQDAERAVGLLSSYFRRTLSLDPLADVPLHKEIELHSVYLGIEQLRYPDLKIDIDVLASLRNAAVPALLLQPLIENAIKHGVARSRPPTCLGIHAAAEAGQIVLRVVNKGQAEPGAPPAEGCGIGLNNVRSRLLERFGDKQEVIVRPSRGAFEVILKYPLVFL